MIGTGDYNFDARCRRRGGAGQGAGQGPGVGGDLRRTPCSVTVALLPTHPPTGRYIDYVHAANSDLRAGHIEMLDQRIFAGLNSDHRPLLVWLALR